MTVIVANRSYEKRQGEVRRRRRKKKKEEDCRGAYVDNGVSGNTRKVGVGDFGTLVLATPKGNTNEPIIQPSQGWDRDHLSINPVGNEEARGVGGEDKGPSLKLEDVRPRFVGSARNLRRRKQ